MSVSVLRGLRQLAGQRIPGPYIPENCFRRRQRDWPTKRRCVRLTSSVSASADQKPWSFSYNSGLVTASFARYVADRYDRRFCILYVTCTNLLGTVLGCAAGTGRSSGYGMFIASRIIVSFIGKNNKEERIWVKCGSGNAFAVLGTLPVIPL